MSRFGSSLGLARPLRLIQPELRRPQSREIRDSPRIGRSWQQGRGPRGASPQSYAGATTRIPPSRRLGESSSSCVTISSAPILNAVARCTASFECGGGRVPAASGSPRVMSTRLAASITAVIASTETIAGCRPAAQSNSGAEARRRSHWICAEPGWEEVADYALEWALTHAEPARSPAV